jgi:hypothetical protein
MGIRGLVPGFPEPSEALGDGPSVEPLVGLELPRAWADETPKAVWPRVLTPDDGTLTSGIDATSPPPDKVHDD